MLRLTYLSDKMFLPKGKTLALILGLIENLSVQGAGCILHSHEKVLLLIKSRFTAVLECV